MTKAYLKKPASYCKLKQEKWIEKKEKKRKKKKLIPKWELKVGQLR